MATRHFDPLSAPEPDWDRLLPDEVEGVVRKQRGLGVDVVNDGEFSKSNWLFYAASRLGGFGDASVQPPSLSGGLGGASDMAQFPGCYRDAGELDGVSIWRRHSESFFPNPEAPLELQACVGPHLLHRPGRPRRGRREPYRRAVRGGRRARRWVHWGGCTRHVRHDLC